MTTGAYDGKIVAIESNTTGDGMFMGHVPKLVHLPTYGAVIFAGNMDLVDVVALKIFKGDTDMGFLDKEGSFQAIYLTVHGECFYWGSRERFHRLPGKYAIGSGTPYALTAMHQYQADACEAVKAGITMDAYSAGTVTYYDPETDKVEGNHFKTLSLQDLL